MAAPVNHFRTLQLKELPLFINALKEQKEETSYLNTEWVFPSQNRIKNPMSDGTVNKAIKQLHPRKIWDGGSHRTAHRKQSKVARHRDGISLTLHGRKSRRASWRRSYFVTAWPDHEANRSGCSNYQLSLLRKKKIRGWSDGQSIRNPFRIDLGE